jgi:hypothetical protein
MLARDRAERKGAYMRRASIVWVTVAVVVAAVGVGAAFAALPKKGGVYVGTVKATPFEMGVNIGVTPDGKKLRFTYLCGTGRAPTIVFGVPIDATGHFGYTKKTGTIVVWKMLGHFTSSTKAFVSLNSLACGGSKGSATLTLKQ